MERMTTKEYLALRTDDQLERERVDLCISIDVVECFSTRDLVLREEIYKEQERRQKNATSH